MTPYLLKSPCREAVVLLKRGLTGRCQNQACSCNGTGWIGHVRCPRCNSHRAFEAERLHCSVARTPGAVTGDKGYCNHCWPMDCGCFL